MDIEEHKLKFRFELRKKKEKTILEFTEEEIKSKSDKILQVLKKESIDLKSWFYLVIYYYSIGDYQNFKRFSEEFSKSDVELNPYYRDQKQIFIYILNIFSFFYSLISQQCKDKSKSDNYSTASTSFVNQAEKISMYDPMTMICKGFLFFAQGEYENSDMYFSNISDNDNNKNLNRNLIILAKIGRGLNSYNKGKYDTALEYFISLIRDYDCINEDVLECVALCYYNLGILNKSKGIFQKILQMNPCNYRVQTYMSILTLVTSDYSVEDYEISFQQIKEAFVNDEESEFHMLLIQLANIFLLAGKVTSAEEISIKLNNLLEFGEMRGNTGRDSKNKGEKYRRDLDEIKSSIHCISAKILHFKNNNTEAFSYYTKAVQSNPKNIEAQYGLGQIYLSMQNMIEAEKCFLACKSIQESTNLNSKGGALQGSRVSSNEASFEIIKYLAYISSKIRKKEIDTTIDMYKKALEINCNDTDCYIELAQLLEYKKPEESLKYYEELMVMINKNKSEEKVHEQTKANFLYNIDDNMPEILNNIATIKIRLHSFNDVEKLLNEAKTLVKNQKEKLIKQIELKTEDKTVTGKIPRQNELMTKYKSLEMAISFNFAIYYESNYQFGEAYKNYKQILKENPYFIEAYIKLGLLAKLRGNKPKAIGYMKQALEKHFEQQKEDQLQSNSLSSNLNPNDKGKKFISVMRKPINPLLIMAQINYDMGNESEALSNLSNILKAYDDKDPYTLVLLANIYYDMASLLRNKSSDFYANLNRSLELYHRALEADKYNSYAAIGIANVLSEYNLTSYSLETYKNTTEKFPNNHNAYLNEALIYINDNKFEKASIILSKLLKKYFRNKCPDIENLLAKSLIEMKDFDKAIKVLKGLILRHPDNIFYKFNYALCLKQHAEDILNKPERRVKETEEAIKNLETAIPIFDSILLLRKEINQNLSEREEKIMKNSDFYYKCHEVLEFLKLYLSTARQILEKDRFRERETIRKIEENKIRYLKMLETQKEMDEKEREEIHRKMKENEKLAESYKHIADQIIQVTTREEKESKKNKKKKEKSFDDFVEPEKNYKADEDIDYYNKHEKRRSDKKHKKNKKRRERNSDEEDLMDIDEAYVDPHDKVDDRKKLKKLKKRHRSEEEEIDFFGNFNDREEEDKILKDEPKQEENIPVVNDEHQSPHSYDNARENNTENNNMNIKDVEMKDYTKNELDDELDFS